MASAHEPAKALLPYLQRADELQSHEPVVAYYCRLYAMDRGLKIPQKERTAYTNSLLSSLIKQLEKDKKSLTLRPDDNLHLEGFALNVFAKADKQDRAGRADINTAKTFYAASIFFEILNQFGPLQPDLEQKQKYAAWKAADIRKAFKEGRKPVPGPPAGDEDISELGPGSDTFISTPSRDADLSDQIQDKAERPFNMPTSPPQQPPSSYLSQDFQQPPPITRSESSLHTSPPQHPPSSYPSHDFQQPPPITRSESSLHTSSPQHPPSSYPSHDFQQPPPIARSESSLHSSSNHQQPYLQETQQHLPQNYHSETQQPQLHSYPSGQFQQMPHDYPSEPHPQLHTQQHYPSHETSNYSYPHFQSYPSFSESTLPSVPSQYPSYYQGSEASYSSQMAQPATTYATTTQHSAASRNGAISETVTTPIRQQYTYDSNYQPPPEKISEAHKAARFAVGALAFDEVSVAVEHLQKALELLTNPSAGQSSR